MGDNSKAEVGNVPSNASSTILPPSREPSPLLPERPSKVPSALHITESTTELSAKPSATGSTFSTSKRAPKDNEDRLLPVGMDFSRAKSNTPIGLTGPAVRIVPRVLNALPLLHMAHIAQLPVPQDLMRLLQTGQKLIIPIEVAANGLRDKSLGNIDQDHIPEETMIKRK
ncbi:hypothetical protein RvY_10131 [Ramazzottius varieornatus]|uniref:Uncharacterized protein n=1 Tax=Ramazzottius varieornatus TaxID=947166 RepID=A0A1D1VBS1_RAMVA|nr:hypothetical protein RvY_10131 [Ramazzottius varieornatus]